jgi:glycosyltransferase involved in cell wall biosynthesis
VQVLGFGTYDVRTQPRAGIMLDGLRASGAQVRELNAPLGFSTAERVAMLHAPSQAYRLILRLARRWTSLVGRRVTSRVHPDVVVVGYLGHFDVLLARLLFPRTTIVLDQLVFAADTARDRGAGHPVKLGLLSALDQLAIRSASVVVLDTAEHADLLPTSQRAKAVVVPVGAEPAWFAARPTQALPEGPLRVVFFGLYTPLQGAVTIGEALSRLADRSDIQVTMIGGGQDRAAAENAAAANPNVRWLDFVEPEQLRTLVAAHDVCLGIFGTGAKGLRVVPNKIYQGAAAGCAIITSDTAPQRRVFGDGALYVAPGDSAALAAALVQLADDVDRLNELRDAAATRADEYFRPVEVITELWNDLDRRGLVLEGPNHVLSRLQAHVSAAAVRAGHTDSAVDQLITERRAEAAAEDDRG